MGGGASFVLSCSTRDVRFRLEKLGRMDSARKAVFVLVPTGDPPLLRFGHPDVTFGRYRLSSLGVAGYRAGAAAFSGCALRVSARTLSDAERGGAERPGDGCPCVGAEEICGAPPLPCGEERGRTPSLEQSNVLKRRTLRPYPSRYRRSVLFNVRLASAYSLLSNAEVAQQECVIPRNLTPTHWSMQIPSARGTKSACGRVYAVGVSTAYSVTPRLLSKNA